MAAEVNKPKRKEFSEKTKFVLSVSIPALIAIIGWGVVNYLGAVRDRENKLRDVKIDYLIQAYTTITDAVVNGLYEEQYLPQLNKAWSQIQLVGSSEEIRLAHEMMAEMNSKNYGDANELLKQLRDDLRKSLNLEYEDSDITHLMLHKDTIGKHLIIPPKDSIKFNYK